MTDSFVSLALEYLSKVSESLEQHEKGEYTAELSYRPILHRFISKMAGMVNHDIKITYEPRRQSVFGSPDWRFYHSHTLGIYGYAEAKPINVNKSIQVDKHSEQVSRYLKLGHKVILTDGLDFVFIFPEKQEMRKVSLVRKPVDFSKLSGRDINSDVETYFRLFFKDVGLRRVSEEQLIQDVAKRASILSSSIEELTDLPIGAGLNEQENKTIKILRKLKQILENHHDPNLRTPKAFADFVSQVLVFGLLYAHRVVCRDRGNPSMRYRKIGEFWDNSLKKAELARIRPFRELYEILSDELNSLGPLGTWYEDCRLFLSYIDLEEEKVTKPDYHILYERFLTVFDPKTRFDYGAFYTPWQLAQFTVKLAETVVAKEFKGRSVYEKGNKLIDPCCGTGTFIEQLLIDSPKPCEAKIIGFEILPAPYALAHYRLEMLTNKEKLKNTELVLTNTLSDELESSTKKEPENLIEIEQEIAKELAKPPITLVIGNPPSSDSGRSYTHHGNFDIINGMMEDFRPPREQRTSRQNIQKQIQNEFLKFLRWSCNKLKSSEIGIFALVLPSSFLEHGSYKFARKWLVDNYEKMWILDLDLDARTGIRESSIFNTLQGRSLLVGIRSNRRREKSFELYYLSIADLSKDKKIEELTKRRDPKEILNMFKPVEIERRNLCLRPQRDYDKRLWQQFWQLFHHDMKPENNRHVFERHSSSLKLAPSSMFVHVNPLQLARRSRDIANKRISYDDIIRKWFSGQDKPPKREKLSESVRDAFKHSLTGRTNLIRYCYRPFLNTSALISETVFKELAKQKNSGTRYRPEVLSAFSNPKTLGIAVSPSPIDLGESLHRFASFCWHLPDNDLSRRGNAHVFCNFFPKYKTKKVWEPVPIQNINNDLISELRKIDNSISVDDVVFYVYAILSSSAYLDEFEAPLFTSSGREIPRIPVVADGVIFKQISKFGRDLANLERDGPDLNFKKSEYFRFRGLYRRPFKLSKFVVNQVDESLELYDDSNLQIKIQPIPLEIVDFQVSGYNVIQQWLKLNSYRYTRSEVFTVDQYMMLLSLLHKIDCQIKISRNVDKQLDKILSGQTKLL